MEWELSSWYKRTITGSTLLGAALAAGWLVVFPHVARTHWDTLTHTLGGEQRMKEWAPLIAHAVQFWAFNAFYIFLYWMQHPAVEKYKVSRKPWPWKSSNAGERERFWSTVRASLIFVPLNQVIQIPMHMRTLTLTDKLGALSVKLEDFPTTFTLVWQLAVCLFVEDLMFYWTHRMLHIKALYPWVHKIHHRFYNTICFSSEMAHPVEYILGNLIPVLAGPLLLRAHMFTMVMFIWLRIAVSIEEHCGYSFPWSPVRLLPLGATVEGHDYHHSHNKGMFASQFIWWDWLCGTDRDFEKHMEHEDELKALPANKVPANTPGSISDEEGDPDELQARHASATTGTTKQSVAAHEVGTSPEPPAEPAAATSSTGGTGPSNGGARRRVGRARE